VEFAIKALAERKQLMQAVYDYLKRTGIEAELRADPAYNLDLYLDEPIIRLQNRPINSISLYTADIFSCGISGGILRFHYMVKTPRHLESGETARFAAYTKPVKENRTMGMFGGKITSVKWEGKELASALNEDKRLNETLLRCATTTGEIDFSIEVIRRDEVHIWGPRFSDPISLSAKFISLEKGPEKGCVFCIETIDVIARHILELIK
jgi:hypothetical protein